MAEISPGLLEKWHGEAFLLGLLKSFLKVDQQSRVSSALAVGFHELTCMGFTRGNIRVCIKELGGDTNF